MIIKGDCYDCKRVLIHGCTSGIAMSADRVLYFADGTAIRFVDHAGIIGTIVGRPANPVFGLQPAPCNMAVKPDQVGSINYSINVYH